MKPGLTGIEFGDRAYVFSLDTGMFTLGEPRKDDGMPQPEEQYLSVLTPSPPALELYLFFQFVQSNRNKTWFQIGIWKIFGLRQIRNDYWSG